MTKKTGYKITSYNEDKSGLKTNATIAHVSIVPRHIAEAFEDDPWVRQITVHSSKYWNSFTKRVYVYQKKGR